MNTPSQASLSALLPGGKFSVNDNDAPDMNATAVCEGCYSNRVTLRTWAKRPCVKCGSKSYLPSSVTAPKAKVSK